jgi:hypothetical protein
VDGGVAGDEGAGREGRRKGGRHGGEGSEPGVVGRRKFSADDA